jgi:plastocyanin
MHSMRRSIIVTALLIAATAALAAGSEHVVGQKNKSFSARTLKVKVGDTVGFRNDDPFFHNIFSLSEVQSFDLGSFPQGQSRKTTFGKAGTIEVECAIHPEMKMIIQVEK